jgi:hypothetical protein
MDRRLLLAVDLQVLLLAQVLLDFHDYHSCLNPWPEVSE